MAEDWAGDWIPVTQDPADYTVGDVVAITGLQWRVVGENLDEDGTVSSLKVDLLEHTEVGEIIRVGGREYVVEGYVEHEGQLGLKTRPL